MTYDPEDESNVVSDETALKLTRLASGGCEEAWREFLNVYAGLILDMVRRHLPGASEDDVRTVFVDLLQELYEGGLAKYSGQSRLSTWLFVFARRRVVDFWRSTHGRHRDPAGASRLTELERDVLQMYYVERLGLEAVVHLLNCNGTNRVNAREIVDAIERIESTVDRRVLKRINDEHSARARGGNSVRLLEYVVHKRVEYERCAGESSPDAALMEREARRTVDLVKALVAELSEDDRRVIELRFQRQMRAREISEVMKLGDPRKVYTIMDRALRRLRRALRVAQSETTDTG